MNPVISIVIPCWNCGDGIGPKYLDKLLNQSYREWECICVDNSPDDCTFSVLEKYARKDSRITAFRSEPNKASPARNAGIERAGGDFVWIVDCDDELVLGPDSLGDLVKQLTKLDCDVAMVPCEQWKSGRPNRSHYMSGLAKTDLAGTRYELRRISPEKLSALVKLMHLPPWCKILKREFLVKNPDVRFLNARWANDWYFSAAAYNAAKTFGIVKSGPVYRQHKRAGSISGMSNKRKSAGNYAIVLNAQAKIEFWSPAMKKKFYAGRIDRAEKDLKSIAERNGGKKTIAEVADGFSECDDVSELSRDIPADKKILRKAVDMAVKRKKSMNQTESSPAGSDMFGYSRPEEKHDILFVLGRGSKRNDEEIMYAMAAARKFCSSWLRDIFVVGAKPRSWDKAKKYKFTWLECDDPYSSKDANIIHKVKYAIENLPEMSDTFLVCSDDSLPIKESSWEDFRPRECRVFDPNDKKFYKTCNCGKGGWLGNLYTTLTLFVGKRSVVRYFQPHCWAPVEKASFLKMCEETEWTRRPGNIVKSLYYNYIAFPDPRDSSDLVFQITPPSVSFCRNLGSDGKIRIVSYNDNAFDFGPFRDALKRLTGA